MILNRNCYHKKDNQNALNSVSDSEELDSAVDKLEDLEQAEKETIYWQIFLSIKFLDLWQFDWVFVSNF